MSKEIDEKKTFSSYQEYAEKYFPQQNGEELAKISNPREFGANIAKAHLKKLNDILREARSLKNNVAE